MVGAGIIILVPVLIATKAGPSFFLSMLIGGIIMGFTAVSYTDLSSRYTCIGNAYVYVYAGIGEYPAVITASIAIGEFLLHRPLIAKLCSQQINVIVFGGTFREMEQNFYVSTIGIPRELVDNTDFDILTFAMIMITLLVLLLPIKYGIIFSSVVLCISVASLLIYSIYGLYRGSIDNMTAINIKAPSQTGFMPFGVTGMLQSAAITAVFYTGFETTSSLSEECVNPKQDVPRGTLMSYFIVLILYVFTSFCMAYSTPWYTLKDGLIPTIPEQPLLQYILGIATVAISVSVMISMSIADARIIYSLSVDGLFPKCFARVSTKAGVPYMSIILICIIFQIVTALLTAQFITDLLSEGILTVYVCVNISLVCTSYKHKTPPEETTPLIVPQSSPFVDKLRCYAAERVLLVVMLLFTACCVIPVAVLYHVDSVVVGGVASVMFGIPAIILLISINCAFDPVSPGYFSAPFKPYLQGMGIALSMFLMNSLRLKAILSIIVSATIGSVIYFCYGIHNSKITLERQKEVTTNGCRSG